MKFGSSSDFERRPTVKGWAHETLAQAQREALRLVRLEQHGLSKKTEDSIAINLGVMDVESTQVAPHIRKEGDTRNDREIFVEYIRNVLSSNVNVPPEEQ